MTDDDIEAAIDLIEGDVGGSAMENVTVAREEIHHGDPGIARDCLTTALEQMQQAVILLKDA